LASAEALKAQYESNPNICVPCRLAGRCRLGIINFRLTKPNNFRCEIQCPTSFEGGPGFAHGGWITTAFDEVMCWTCQTADKVTPAITGRIEVDFYKPVPLETDLYVISRVYRRKRRRVYAAAAMHLADAENTLLARAKGVFIIKTLHFYAGFPATTADGV
jgi:acyl-coenzyme A thioesterase PaaI-like protein